MAKGISISVASDTRDFAKGVALGIIEPLEDANKALEELAREGDQAGDKLEKTFREQQRETTELARDHRALTKVIRTESFERAQAIKKGSADATRVAKGDLQELGNEAKQNLAETLSSFDGTVEGTINGIQGTLGGVTAGLTGIIPIIAAAAGAAGLGLITVAFQQQSAEAEKVKAKVAQLAGEYIETGEVGKRSVEGMVDALRELAISHEDGEQSLSALAQAAKDAGLPFDKIARAYVGNSEELEKLIKANERHIASLLKERDEMQTGVDNYLTKTGALTEQADATEKLNETLGKNLEVTRAAEDAEAAYLASGAPAMEAKAELISQINDAYDDTAAAVDNYINKESGLFDVAAYITALQAKEEALKNYQNTLAASGLSTEAKQFLADQGAETAALILQGYQSAAPEQKAELERLWTEYANDSSGAFQNQVGVNLTAFKPTPVKVPLEIDDSALKAYKPAPIKVRGEVIGYETASGRRIF